MIKLLIMILCSHNLNATEYWNIAYTAFTASTINNNEGLSEYNQAGWFKISNCGGVLFGGFNAFGTGTKVSKLITIPAHFKLRFSLQFMKIDSWDSEFLYLFLDDYVYTRRWGFEGVLKCGPGNYDFLEDQANLEFIFEHRQPTLSIIMTTTLNEGVANESWGFRDFKVEYIFCSYQ